ncbi:hypothetical protein OE88DRAFT_1654466 [Heliocybe sulcata]|uniref:BTB domain-containing protein n=1 Tax=Heliocybe sulcata TaxID=5364 RepID=A0A5C3N8J5_9AGAM|nr:hypothetical protein OE88DRAFT_1654466 [Heliocybe sulcata]
MERTRESLSHVVESDTFEIELCRDKVKSGETTFWSDRCGAGWRCGISISATETPWDDELRIHAQVALDLSNVDPELSSLTFSADFSSDSSRISAVAGYVIKLPNDDPVIPHDEVFLGTESMTLSATFKVSYAYHPKRLPSEMQETLKSTIANGSFTDTKFLVYSQRRGSGQVGTPLPLFANSAALKKQCPSYFEPLFSDRFTELSDADGEAYDYYSDSDYSEYSDEDETVSPEEPEWESSSSAHDMNADSNAAAGAGDATSCGVPAFNDSGYEGGSKIRTVVVADFAFRTYRALIYYLYTGDVSFAPLKSSRSHAPTPAVGKEASDTRERTDDLRCSSKSMYRLADKLGLDSLKKQAFAYIQSSVSETNIVQEIGSRFTGIPEYDEVRRVQLQILSKKWAVPGVKEAFLALLKRAMQGELPHATDTLLAFISGVKPAL